MRDASMRVGQVADRAGVATSAVRHCERLGLLVADARQSGQRRYTPATLRPAGVHRGCCRTPALALDESRASSTRRPLPIGRRSPPRIDLLDEEIRRLKGTRAYSPAPYSAATTTPPPTAKSWTPR